MSNGHEQRKAGDLAKEQSLINIGKTDIKNIIKETKLGAKDLEKNYHPSHPGWHLYSTLEESIKEKQDKK